MSAIVPTTSYEDFVRANQTLHEHGGPWTTQSAETPGAEVEVVVGGPCGGPVCLCCYVDDEETPGVYHTNYLANISVDMAKYGNPSRLEFSWAFWPAYLKTGPTAGTTFPVKSQIGDASFTDTISATDYTAFHVPGGVWDWSNKISHNGTVTLSPSAGGSTAYILVNVSFAITHSTRNETLAFYSENPEFLIKTPALDNNGETSTASTSKISVGAIVGEVIGALVLITLIALGIILCWRQRKRKATSLSEKAPITVTETFVPPATAPTAHTSWSIPPNGAAQYDYGNGSASHPSSPSAPWTIPPTPGSQGEQPLLAAVAPMNRTPTYMSSSGMSNRPMSAASSTAPRGASPPVYGSSVYAYGNAGGPLATWANANRAFITEDLESKLASAGFLPSDNPDDLTEEEWTSQFGLTKLEVLRLRKLYAGSHPRTDAPV